jgi:hypothetical protein
MLQQQLFLMARKGSQKGDVARVFAPVTEAHHKK